MYLFNLRQIEGKKGREEEEEVEEEKEEERKNFLSHLYSHTEIQLSMFFFYLLVTEVTTSSKALIKTYDLCLNTAMALK